MRFKYEPYSVPSGIRQRADTLRHEQARHPRDNAELLAEGWCIYALFGVGISR